MNFRVDQFDDLELADITSDHADAASVGLATRNMPVVVWPERTGKLLAPSTHNRDLAQLANVFRYAHRLK